MLGRMGHCDYVCVCVCKTHIPSSALLGVYGLSPCPSSTVNASLTMTLDHNAIDWRDASDIKKKIKRDAFWVII